MLRNSPTATITAPIPSEIKTPLRIVNALDAAVAATADACVAAAFNFALNADCLFALEFANCVSALFFVFSALSFSCLVNSVNSSFDALICSLYPVNAVPDFSN